MRDRCRLLLAALLLLYSALFLRAETANGLNQDATVYIKVECEDPNNGVVSEFSGSGFIVEKSGYIVTALHVLSCVEAETRRQLTRKRILVRVGSPYEPVERRAEMTNFSVEWDISVLQMLGARRDYPTLKLCSLSTPPPGMSFVAAGFPEGKGYQPVSGLIGNSEGEGGVWSVSSPFTHGMSGGPVLHSGFVIGIIKGGARNITALSAVTPISKVGKLIESETGQNLPLCAFGYSPPQPSKDNLPGPDEFKPTITFSGNHWGFFMPVRFQVKYEYISSTVKYAFKRDGYYETAYDRLRFFTSELPDTQKLFIKIELATNETLGPFEYDVDYKAIRESAMIKDALASGRGTAVVLQPDPRDKNSFPLIVDYEAGSVKRVFLRAIVPENIVKYKISIGGSFSEVFPVSDKNLLILDFLQNFTSEWKPQMRLSITAITATGRDYGPAFFNFDLSTLIKRVWRVTFDERNAITCEYVEKSKMLGCYPTGRPDVWAGVVRVDYGTSPEELKSSIDIPEPDSDLVSVVRVWVLTLTKQEAKCSGESRFQDCFFITWFPGSTPSIYARFHYFDGSVSEIFRFEAPRR